MKFISSRYTICQVGICLFWRVDEGVYRTAPYNFYVIPDDNGNITCDVSTIHFLKDNGMDFNKWLYSGVPFVNAFEEQNLRQRMLKE